mgnify:CR=1 FL=1
MTYLSYFSQFGDWGLWFLQFAVGVIFIYHGWPKLKNMKKFFGIGGSLHGLVEVLGGLALIFSVYVREAALVLAVIMLGAIYFKKFKWNLPFSSMNATGWEFDLVLLAANIFLLVNG